MAFKLADELKLKYNPVAIYFSDDKPLEARQIKEGAWGCAMALYLVTMTKGVTAMFDRTTYGCIGAGVGLCLGNTYAPNQEFIDNLLSEEEGYLKSKELVRDFTDNFPYMDIPQKYVIFRPLSDIEKIEDKPALISFPANPDQLSALTVLINFRRKGIEHVRAPFCAGCQSICVYPANEIGKDEPQAIIGNIDLTSRRVLPADILTFTVPYKTFLEMEEDVELSFIKKKPWAQLVSRIK